MNKLFMLLFLFPILALSAENCTTDIKEESVESQLIIKTDVPKHLEGAVIIVRTKDGRESVVPAEKFKVVPRKQQFIVTKTKQVSETLCKSEKEKNRLSLNLGNGPKSGLDVTQTSSQATVENRLGLIGGLQYQRLVTDEVNVGLQVLNNKSVILGVGLDF